MSDDESLTVDLPEIPDDFKRRAAEIQKAISDTISKGLNIPVFSIGQEPVDAMLEGIRQLPGVAENYSPSELHDEVTSFLSSTIVFRPKDEGEHRRRIEEFVQSLGKEKTYNATIILPNVIGLPIGTRLGAFRVVTPDIQDKDLLEVLAFQREHKHVFTEGRAQAEVTFSAYTSTSPAKNLYKLLELPLAILSLLLDFDLDSRDCAGAISSPDVPKKFFLQPQRETRGWTTYNDKHHGQHLSKLSTITLAATPTSLQRKILQALQVYGLSRLSYKQQIRFILIISAFESLLLTKNDRDYLGKKLAEKTAFLLETEFQRRIRLYKHMKRAYRKRSELVHSGKGEVSASEVDELNEVFRTVILRLLDLSSSYATMEQRARDGEPEGVEDLINRWKFS